MPEGAVYVGRPTKWGNPYKVDFYNFANFADAVEAYRRWIMACNHLSTIDVTRIKTELRGKDLACWCPLYQPCHADVLLEIANSENGGLRE